MSNVRLKAGERVGDRGHLVVGLISLGGHASVYDAIDGRDGARRIIKFVDDDPQSGPESVKLHERLAQEGEALAMIDHVNVVRFYEAGVHQGRVFLLLERVEGQTLREKLVLRPSIECVVRWIRQACEGVAEAHRVGILHRDLKPENLLVAPNDVVKVIDFGVAKIAYGVATTFGHRVGTANYMAPEYIRTGQLDAKADVYSMGLILYEALTGANPMGGPQTNMLQACSQQLSYQPPPVQSVRPDVPSDLAELVDRCVLKDPTQRPDMRELIAGLQSALGRLLVPQIRAARNVSVPSSSRKGPGVDRTVPMKQWQEGQPPPGPEQARNAVVPPATSLLGPPSVVAGPPQWVPASPAMIATMRSMGTPQPAAAERASSLNPATVSSSDVAGARRRRRLAVAAILTFAALAVAATATWRYGWLIAGRAAGASAASSDVAPAASVQPPTTGRSAVPSAIATADPTNAEQAMPAPSASTPRPRSTARRQPPYAPPEPEPELPSRAPHRVFDSR